MTSDRDRVLAEMTDFERAAWLRFTQGDASEREAVRRIAYEQAPRRVRQVLEPAALGAAMYAGFCDPSVAHALANAYQQHDTAGDASDAPALRPSEHDEGAA